jgi:hypothetical protein
MAAKRFLSTVAFLWPLLWIAFPASGESSSEDALSEVRSMLEQGVPPEAVIAYIEAEDLRFELSAEDIIGLNQAGADADLLIFLLERRRQPVDEGQAEPVFDSEGFRAFWERDSEGRDVLVVTNLDEKGRRTDDPPPIPAEEEPADRDAVEETPPPAEPEIVPAVETKPERAPEASRLRPWQEKIYVGPFHHFVPSNLPGPNSPWSPVFQIIPTVIWPGFLVYPLAQLTPVYPPGFPLYYWCRRTDFFYSRTPARPHRSFSVGGKPVVRNMGEGWRRRRESNP